MHGVLDDQQRARDARHGPPYRGGDEIESERVRAHEGGGVAILRDGADGRAHEGAGEEEVEAQHGQDGQTEGDQAGKGDEDAAHFEHGQVYPHRAMVRAPEESSEGLDEEEESPRGQELIDGRARQNGRDDEEVNEEAQHYPCQHRATPASTMGQWETVTMKYMAYMQSMTRST